MYITHVVATAFGPLRSETLEFATGLNVVHGPNEAGKSSWFNATFAGLAGRRKFKGKGFAAETDFKNRHKPWSGTKWSVGVGLVLDDGRTLAIEQDLAKSEWRIVDESTAQAMADKGLLTDMSLDATRLLGLNRHSARATIFTGQADILRVRADAGELRELLEKAAANEGADANAEGALAWLADRRREWVGVAHGVKPLGMGVAAVDRSQALAEKRRGNLGELIDTIGTRRRLTDALAQARANVELSNSLVKWQSVYAMRSRVDKAAELSAKLAETSEADLLVDAEKVRAATQVLAVFDGGIDAAPLGDGPTAADLQVQIDELPVVPEGDLEPRQEVVAAHSELVRAHTALETHMKTAPPGGEQPRQTALSADELRTLAGVLAATPPEVDDAAVADFERTKREQSDRIAALQREVDEYDSAYQQAKADYDAATLGGSAAAELAGLHSAERAAAEALIDATRRQSAFLLEVLAAQELQADAMAQEVAVRRHREGVDSARERVRAESLEPDPDALRALARTIDEAAAAQKLAQQHADHTDGFRATREDRARVLSRLLGQAAHAEVTDETVAQTLQDFIDYVEVCKARAETAQKAARRVDLVEALTQRQQLEANHVQATGARDAQGRGVVEFAAGLGLAAEPLSAAVDELRRWVREQESKQEAFTARKTNIALLEQLLGGRDLADLKSDLATQTANAGDEPDVPMPTDLDESVKTAKDRLDALVNRDGVLEGSIKTLGSSLGSVAEAVELEADAQRSLAQVKSLASCLDAAAAELENAKERANASIAPALENRMRPWLPRVTNGRYRDVVVDPDDLTMQVTEATGQVRQADRLSLGTSEQIYLLLRVTLSQVLSGGTETAPLIFDDVTTQSDNTRTVAIMELLHELSTEHQVIVFTQEDEVVEWARDHVDLARNKIIALDAP